MLSKIDCLVVSVSVTMAFSSQPFCPKNSCLLAPNYGVNAFNLNAEDDLDSLFNLFIDVFATQRCIFLYAWFMVFP